MIKIERGGEMLGMEEITSFSVHPVSNFGSIQQLHISRVASSENYVTFK